MTPSPSHLRCGQLQNPSGIDESHPSLAWRVESEATGSRQTAYELLAASSAELLARDIGDLWNTGKVSSSQSHGVCYGGLELSSRQRCYWKVRIWDENDAATAFSGPATFETALLRPEDFTAGWIGWPAGHAGLAAHFRCPFTLDFVPERAVLYISGLGLYHAFVNGVRMPGLLQPAVSDYGRRVYYNTYDVTAHLQRGENVAAAVVGSGWLGTPILWAQLEIYGPDNRRVVVETVREKGKPVWMVSNGPTRTNSLFDGETYDATKEKPGWTRPGYKAGPSDLPRAEIWLGACAVRSPGGTLRAQPIEPVQIVRELPARSLNEPLPGVFVFDFGQNHAGWARLRVSGPRGTVITLKYAEILGEDGTANQENLRSALATDTYILKGEGGEVWEPSFTYHGYRYVQVEGWPGRPQADSLVACVVRSALEDRGRFSCDNPLLNQLHEVVRWTEESNLHGIPTDCPQRDERMGWLNDMTARTEELVCNFEAAAFLAKFVEDIADSQAANGAISDTAPFFSGSLPADPVCIGYLLIPYTLYQHYGDTRLMQRHYDGMSRWVEFLAGRSEDGILEYSHYGDWAPPATEALAGTPGGSALSANTNGGLVSTAFFHHSLVLLSRIAGILGKGEDQARYSARADHVRDAFHSAFWSAGASGYGSGNQASNSIALYFDLVPAELRDRVINSLVADVRARGHHLSTGNLATKYLLEVLSEAGFSDDAYRLAAQTTYPSWGYMIGQGATTLWERWEELSSGGMNSHNHAMLGSVGSWFYRHVAGIFMECAEGGTPRVGVRIPMFSGLSESRASLVTAWGEAAVAWRRSGPVVNVSIQVPWNCPAIFHAPGRTHYLTAGHHFFTIPHNIQLSEEPLPA